MSAASGSSSTGGPLRGRVRRVQERRERLSPDAKISFAAEREAAGIDEVLRSLDEDLVGLQVVKQRVAEIASLLLVDRVRRRFGLQAPRPSLHMCFTGSPGTGKTTVGLRMAELLKRLGYLDEGQLVSVMRDELVGQFVGQTAPMTHKAMKRAIGGVLFIDEAYHLYRDESGKDYGQEAIEVMMQVMENQRDKLVVIFAGYPDRMEAFLESNPGLRSRIAFHLHFADYTVPELDAIGRVMMRQSGYYLSDDATAAFHRYLDAQRRDPRFANGRTVRNALEAARFKHAARLTADTEREWSRDELMRIDAADLVIEGLDSADIARNMTKVPLEQSGPRRSYTGAQSGQGPR
jgi:probable Rubsico expression protein CbbX